MLGDTRFEPRSQVRQFSCTDLRRDAPERMDDTACTGPVGVGQGLTKLRSEVPMPRDEHIQQGAVERFLPQGKSQSQFGVEPG